MCKITITNIIILLIAVCGCVLDLFPIFVNVLNLTSHPCFVPTWDYMGTRNLSQRTLDTRQGTPCMVPILHRAHLHTQTQLHTMDNLEMPVRLLHIIGPGKKTRVPSGNPWRTWTQGRGRCRTPNPWNTSKTSYSQCSLIQADQV